MLIDEATTSLRTGWSSSASSSTPVPAVLAAAYSAGSYMLWPTPTRAARWTTESTPSSAPRTTSALRTSPASSSASADEVLGPLRVAVHLLDEAVEHAHAVAGAQAARPRDASR